MREIEIGATYKHFKGMKVEVIAIAKDSETLKELVVYKHFDTQEYWVRDMKEFLSEVDHEKYPEIKQKYRFEKIQ